MSSDAVEILEGDDHARVLLTCEHATNRLPEPWVWPEADLRLVDTHWAIDLGVADVTRKLAIGDINSSQAQTQVQSALSAWTQTFTCIVTMPSGTSKDCAVEIRVPKASVSLMDIFGMFQSGNLTAKVVMRYEDGT